jgi:flagellar biosynthesis/type III secretory pathway M-ring protein FliF/YscJ
VGSLKERWQKLADKTKKQLITIAVGTVLIAGAIIVFLYLNQDRSYSTLFTGLNQEEATQVVSLLQNSDVTYKYNESDGSISVPSAVVDQTRATLVSQGYPQSGFSYSMYLDHTGLMSTESDKKQYTLYELQDRLGAQIRLFDGVRDAKVTIAEPQEQKYAYNDDAEVEASAAVTVTMENGRSLTVDGANAIRRLISTAVRGMNFTSISVYDAATMLEVGGGTDGDSTYGAANDLNELTTLIENKMAADVRRILEKIYGQGSVEVAVKGTLNMESLIQESTTYSTPEKKDENDKTGLKYYDTRSGENGQAAEPDDGDVAGADANAEVPRYTTDSEGDDLVDRYAYDSVTREWLFNSVKEQRQVDPGVLENTTVSVVIDTDDTSVPENSLRNLVANATGISPEDAAANITIVRTLSVDSKKAAEEDDVIQAVQPEPEEPGFSLPLPILIALAALAVLILLLIILLILRGRKKKKKAAAEEQLAVAVSPGELGAAQENWSGDEFPGATQEAAMQLEEDDEMSQNEEIIKLKMQRNLKLKQNIGEIVDQNPQIVAKLVQGWLNEEGEKNGGGHSADKQKHK